METQTLAIPVVWPEYYEDCVQCTDRLREALAGMDGMLEVTVNTDGRTLQVSYDKDLLTFEEIKERARLLGVTVAERYTHQSMAVAGLDCPDCALKLETALRRMPGVAWASLNYATSILIVEFEPERISLQRIRDKVRDFGYEVEPDAAAPEAPRRVRLRGLRLTLTAASGLLLAAGLVSDALGWTPGASALYLLSAVSGGVFAARTGILSLKGLTMDTNLLMTVAAVGAIWLREYSEAAAVMFLFSLGSTLEAYTMERTRRSIKSLIEAFPTHAWVKRDGALQEIPLDKVEIGEIVLVRPGERVVVDGTVVGGESAVNEAPITGESVPKEKRPGERVFAGSINGRGALEVRTTSTADDNTLSRIIHLVEEAQAQKAPSQRFSETFGRYYTPAVIVLAALVAVLGLGLGGAGADWLKRALTLLVVACPCALVISTPVAIVAAIGNAARSGVLIKGGAYLEALGEVTIAAFDKTGTLTSGKLSVTQVTPFNGHSAEEVISVAAAVESRSEHPLAEAITRKARETNARELKVSFFEGLPGRGARAVVNGDAFYVGSRRLLAELSIDVPASTAMAAMLTSGASVVYVATERELWGAIAASDTVKASSAQAISGLKQAGIRKTVMLTGDTAQTARAVAREVGVDEVYPELLPEDKLDMIRRLSSGQDMVAMVGDGINDAPALAVADVGVAMGGAGSHAAIEAADVALMADDIVMLPYAVALSRRAKWVIIQNVAFALVVVLALVGGALLKWVNLATGVLGHEGSALLVIANSMRLLKR